MLATPILFEKYLLGVLQLINKRGGGAFTPKDEEAAEELAKILGIAFYNQHRAARTNKPSKFGLLVDKGLVSEKDIENAVSTARVNQLDVAKVLIEDYKVPKEEIGRALAQFYNCAFVRPGRPHHARGPEGAAHRRLPEEEHVRAASRRRTGTLKVAVEDPYDLTRLDAIKAMNLAPRHDFVVGAAGDIIDYINAQLRPDRRSAGRGAATCGRIIMELGSGEEDEVEERGRRRPRPRSTRPTAAS